MMQATIVKPELVRPAHSRDPLRTRVLSRSDRATLSLTPQVSWIRPLNFVKGIFTPLSREIDEEILNGEDGHHLRKG